MEDKIICGCYNVKKSEIVNAIKNGADTVEKVGEVTKAGTGCGKCKGSIQEIIDEVNNDQVICGCYKVMKSEIVAAIENGADTVEKVGAVTKAGTGCGKCKSSIQGIIDEVNHNELICGCYNVKKGEIVAAIENGANTVEKVGKATKAGTGCGNCKGSIEKLIKEVDGDKIVCGCYKVKKNEIVTAIKNGADTVEKVGKATKAGTGCGRCKGNIKAIIEEVNGVPVEEKGFFSKMMDKLKGE